MWGGAEWRGGSQVVTSQQRKWGQCSVYPLLATWKNCGSHHHTATTTDIATATATATTTSHSHRHNHNHTKCCPFDRKPVRTNLATLGSTRFQNVGSNSGSMLSTCANPLSPVSSAWANCDFLPEFTGVVS
jgi:hypothetical protein